MHELKLQPAGPIFGPNFRCSQLDADEIGQIFWTEKTPSRQERKSIEDRIYVDVDKNSAVRLEVVDGQINLNGVVNGARIRKRNDNGDRDHEMRKAEIPPDVPGNVKRVKREDPETALKQQRTPRETTDDNKPLILEPELSFVTDYKFGKVFNFDRTAILEYLAIMVNAVNGRYANTNNASLHIQFKFVGLHIITSATSAAQPFGTQPTGGNYKPDEILQNLSKWAFQNKALLGEYDSLMLGYDIGRTPDHDFTGLAKQGGACDLNSQNDVSNAVLLVQDTGGLFLGAQTLAHELGHSLGAVDEGRFDSFGKCFAIKDDGYLMNDRYGQSRFKLSPCSLKLISRFARSANGSCLSQLSGKPSLRTSALQPGDKVDTLVICKFVHGPDVKLPNPTHFPDHYCRLQDCSGIGTWIILGPGNNGACGIGGKCRNGWCRNQGTPFTLDQLCRINAKDGRLAVYDKKRFPGVDVCGVEIRCLNTEKNSAPIPRPGTTCGDDKICVHKTCTPIDRVAKEDLCIVKTGKDEATVSGNNTMLENGCSTGIKCHYGFEFEYLEEPNNGAACGRLAGGDSGFCINTKCIKKEAMTPDEECILQTNSSEAIFVAEVTDAECTSGIKCAFHDQANYTKMHNNGANCTKGTTVGICREGICIPVVVMEFMPDASGVIKRLNVASVCAKLTSSPDAKVYEVNVGELLDRNQFCSRLLCSVVGRPHVLFRSKGYTPDGTTCGPLRRCKKGRCEICDK